MDVARFNQVLDHIIAHPESWDQTRWHSFSGETHCFAGHAQIMAKHSWGSSASEAASNFLELRPQESNYLFGMDRTLEDFQEISQYARDRSLDYMRIPASILGDYE